MVSGAESPKSGSCFGGLLAGDFTEAGVDAEEITCGREQVRFRGPWRTP